MTYHENSHEFELSDSNEFSISCECEVNTDDYFIIGISQTATERTLAVCHLDGEPSVVKGKVTPLGSISAFSLGLK